MRSGLGAVLVRLAGRNTLRRKGEAVLVVLGSLLGTTIITSSFVVGDTLHATIRDQARTRLGPIDEVVLVHDLALLDPVTHSITSEPLPDTDGTLSGVAASVAVTTDRQTKLSDSRSPMCSRRSSTSTPVARSGATQARRGSPEQVRHRRETKPSSASTWRTRSTSAPATGS